MFFSAPGCICASWRLQEVSCPLQFQHCFLLWTKSHLQGTKKQLNMSENLLLALTVFCCLVCRCVRLIPTWSRVWSTGPGDWAASTTALLGRCPRGVRCGRGFWTFCWTGPTTTYCGNSAGSPPSSCRKISSHCKWCQKIYARCEGETFVHISVIVCRALKRQDVFPHQVNFFLCKKMSVFMHQRRLVL